MTAFLFDTNPNESIKLGLIVLSSDETIEDEFRAMLPKSCSLFHTRIHSAPEVTPDTLMEMKAGLAASAAMIPPSFNLDVVGYACTSGATMRALNKLGAKKIGMVTPYIPDVSQEMRNLLIENGFEISALVSFEVSTEAIVARITADAIKRAVRAAAVDGADAVFVSCTNLRTVDVIDELEDELGIAIVTSNQALAWDMLTSAGISTAQSAVPGRLSKT
jgi:maleate isomerase